uniref:TLC domain-containing protein n=1 Tax=Nothobranchius furzeri TaxID=105023 RepID=A0A8C6L528_NOTFU
STQAFFWLKHVKIDFLVMFIHHLANNMAQVGSLVLCVHDTSDFLLEAAKMANYAKYQRLCDFLFIVFSVVHFITRLVKYPLWVLNSTMFESWAIVGPFPSWWLFNILLLVLQVLYRMLLSSGVCPGSGLG